MVSSSKRTLSYVRLISQTDGVFMCGMSHSPKFSDETITQANAAVSRAGMVLCLDFIEAEGKTAYVNKDRCAACGLCEINCPYSAIAVNDQMRPARKLMRFYAKDAVFARRPAA